VSNLLKVTVEKDGIIVDTREAKRAANGADVVVVSMGTRFEAPELQGEECRYRLSLSSDDNLAKVRAWIIGDMYDEKGKRHWMAFGPYGGPYFRVSKSFRAEYDVPFKGTVMPVNSKNYTWRFDFCGANAPVKFYGARIARYTDMPVEKQPKRKVDPRLIFHASFDGDTPVADFAEGERQPKKANALTYAPGRNGGRAVCFSSELKSFLSYPAENNLLKGRGSIALWYRAKNTNKPNCRNFLFSSGSLFDSRIGCAFPFLWYWDGTLRFDPSNDNDSYALCGIGLSDCNWHHIVVVWNEYGCTYWVDGSSAPADREAIVRALTSSDNIGYSRGNPIGVFALASEIDGRNPLDCVIDDIRIYSDALNEEQVAELWKNDKGEVPPSPDYSAVLSPKNKYEGKEALIPGRIDPSDLELLQDIRFDHIPSGDQFRAVGKLEIKELGGVKYLEVENISKSRFAVKLDLTSSPLHYIEVDYPDNCARTMEFMVQPARNPDSDYTLQVGVLTGRDVVGAGTTPTGRILTHRMPVWTRDAKSVFVATTWHKEEAGAAIAALRVYRVKSETLPTLRIKEPKNQPLRQFGIHFEDTPLGTCFGALNGGIDVPNFIDGVERLAATMKFTGQNLFSFPVSWYRGVNDPAIQSRHPPHFADGLMSVFDRDGLFFMAAVNTYGLPMPQGLVTSESVRDSSLHPSFLSMPEKGYPGTVNCMYNPVHPDTQRHLSNIVDYILKEGVKHKSFKGITLHIHSGFVGWFGSAKTGYNDYCIEAFEKRWNLKVPVDRNDPRRAEKYASWLKANAWDKWLKWRCEEVSNFWIAQAKKIKAARSDLRLWFNFQSCENISREHFMREDFARSMQIEGGIDPRMISGSCDNVIFSEAFAPADARHGIHQRLYDLAPNARKRMNEIWQNKNYYSALEGAKWRWSHQHDRYWESNIGARNARGPHGSAPLTCEWMEEHPWRVSTLNPPGRDALRHFVLPLRFHDIDGMTKGGFLIGTYGMEEYIAPFAQAFRSLPAVEFDTKVNDNGVIIREKVIDGIKWFYIANTTGEKRIINIEFLRGTKNIVTGEDYENKRSLSLLPWDFIALKGDYILR
jgi:hypothetical protein